MQSRLVESPSSYRSQKCLRIVCEVVIMEVVGLTFVHLIGFPKHDTSNKQLVILQ